MKAKACYLPVSVYDFGAWLVAHPWIKRVKLPDVIFERYIGQVADDARYGASGFGDPWRLPVLIWRRRQAMIPVSQWWRRDALFPPQMWRRER